MKRNIIKIFAILVLIAGLVGISVIKSNLSAKRSAESMQSIKDEYFRTRDSLLLQKLDDTTRVYVDSIQNLETFYLAQIDSLNDYHADRESLLTAEIEKQKASNTASKKTTVAKKPPPDTISPKVKAEYNSLLSRLPGDLTDYERRVSTDEIIIELSKKYNLSPEKIKKITGST
jgi:TolA-binding protein